MKHFFSLLLVCVFALGYGQDFSVTFSSGKTLYFNITSKNTVAIAEGKQVVSHDDFWGINKYGYLFYGSLNIPATVTDNGVTYTVTEVGHLSGTNLTSVKIPNTVTKISDGAFSDCKELSTISLPSSLEFIGNNAFSRCPKLSHIELPESLQKIGSEAFANSGLTSIIIPGNVNSIGFRAFDGCNNLISVEINEGVKILDAGSRSLSWSKCTFSKCHRLRTVKLPKSLLYYYYNYNIGTLCGSNCPEAMNAFSDCPSLEKIIVPIGTTAAFEKIISSEYDDKIVEE